MADHISFVTIENVTVLVDERGDAVETINISKGKGKTASIAHNSAKAGTISYLAIEAPLVHIDLSDGSVDLVTANRKDIIASIEIKNGIATVHDGKREEEKPKAMSAAA